MKNSAATDPSPPSDAVLKRNILIAGAILVAATLVAYSNSFLGPFVFDDLGTILSNPTLQKFWPPWSALIGPPGGTTASGRPLVNLSFALNHALGGYDVRGYHAINLISHLMAGLTLFGILRRTFLSEPLRAKFASVSFPLAFTCSALWLLHPLQTAAVTYIVQRAESFAGLFLLLTLYGFIRSTDSPGRLRWQICSVGTCLFGMASKEIAFSAPLLVLLYDRTFVSDTFRDAWQQRRGYYLSLASTWLLLLILIVSTHGRGGSVGAGEHITPWSYGLTQCKAIVHYLCLCLWPSPLIFDYGTAVVGAFTSVLPQALLLVALFSATIFAIRIRSPLGFAGACFFAILAPSSSLVPVVTQTVAEHRMYLPSAVLIVLATSLAVQAAGPRSLWAFLGAAALFGGTTFHRNADYRTPVVLWTDTVAKIPDSKRAHNNLGTALFIAGQNNEALAELETAIRLDPHYASALVNLGRVELQSDRPNAALMHFQEALDVEPNNADAHNGLGFAFAATGRLGEAIVHYQTAVKLAPASTGFRLKLAQALFRSRNIPASMEQFREIIRLEPTFAAAHSGLGTALAVQGNFTEGQRELNEALRLDPNDFDAHYNLANILVEQDRIAEAIAHYEAAHQLRPNDTRLVTILTQARAYLNSSH